jgi:hypothetical protein
MSPDCNANPFCFSFKNKKIETKIGARAMRTDALNSPKKKSAAKNDS